MGVAETKTAVIKSFRLAQSLRERLTEINALVDDDLTPEALTAKKEEMRTRAIDSAITKALKQRQVATTGRETANLLVDDFRIKLDPESVAQLTRSDQAWRGTILPLRDQGKNWSEIAQRVDMDGLLALARFAEQVIGATENKVDAPVILANLRTAADRRLAEIHPDEAARGLFSELAKSEEYEGAVAAIADGISNVRTHTDAVTLSTIATRRVYEVDAVPEGGQYPAQVVELARSGDPSIPEDVLDTIVA